MDPYTQLSIDGYDCDDNKSLFEISISNVKTENLMF